MRTYWGHWVERRVPTEDASHALLRIIDAGIVSAHRMIVTPRSWSKLAVGAGFVVDSLGGGGGWDSTDFVWSFVSVCIAAAAVEGGSGNTSLPNSGIRSSSAFL